MSDISAASSLSDLGQEAGLSDLELIEQDTAASVSTHSVDTSKSQTTVVASVKTTIDSNTCVVGDTQSESSSPKEAISFEIPEHPPSVLRNSAEYLSPKASPNAKVEEKATVEICSLVPLLKLVPALQVEDGHYVVNGEVTTDNMKRVLEYAAKVTDFTHISTTANQSEPKISPALYIWLAQRTTSPLFPTLKKIRLHAVPPDLCYIPILLSSRLTLLEISNISPDSIHIVKSLLAVLPSEAPGIKHLTLCGPQHLPQSALYPISKLKYLKRLEFDDITSIDGISFIQRLATLPRLEALKIIAKRPSTAPSTSPTGKAEGATGFLELKSLNITGSFQTAHDLVTLVSSQMLHTLDVHAELSSNDVVAQKKAEERQIKSKEIDASAEEIAKEKANVAALKLKVDKAEEAVRAADAARREKLLKKRRKKYGNAGFTAKETALRKEVENLLKGSSSEQRMARAALTKATQSYTTANSKLSAMEAAHEKLKTSVVSAPAETASSKGSPALFRQTIDSIVSRWSESLVNFTLSVVNTSPSSKSPEALFELTEPIFLQLERLHALRLLCIEGWRVPVSSFCLKGWPNIRHINLPILNDAPGVNLSALQDFAEHCPHLKSLQLKLDISSLPQLPNESGATFALRHGLRNLTVKSSTGATDKQTQKRLARYLNVLFPYLETVTCLAMSGSSAVELWTEVTELLNLLRVARRDERYRT